MENGVNSEKDQSNTGFIKMPKNIRQIGTIKDYNKVIYVEDYVMTYIKQLSARDYTGCKVAVLLGYYIRTKEGKNLFVKGAVEMKDVDITTNLSFSDEAWTSIYESLKRYFTEVEIVGWALIGPDFFLDNGDRLRKIHVDNFSGVDKILLKMDSIEKEEEFYLYENNQLVKQGGYYIYYEKNEEMQNYMVENKDVVIEERDYIDHTTKKIRTIIKEKKEPKDDKNVIRILYVASASLTIVVLVIAAAMLNNYGQLKNMETAINSMAKTLSMENKKLPEDDETKDNIENVDAGERLKTVETEDIEGNAKEVKSEQETETMAVETVSGNISTDKSADTDEDNTSEEPEQDTTDTGDASAEKETEKPTDSESTNESEKTTDSAQPKDNAKDVSKVAPTKKPIKEETIAETKYYVIKSGDSLASISLKLYNSYNYVKQIKELNGIEDENKIFAGQKIIVP